MTPNLTDNRSARTLRLRSPFTLCSSAAGPLLGSNARRGFWMIRRFRSIVLTTRQAEAYTPVQPTAARLYGSIGGLCRRG